MSPRNKTILITAGPTWVAMDNVRVISNIASGRTGQILAGITAKNGGKATLLMGPVGDIKPVKGVKVLRFRFFDELERALKKELATRRYGAVIHCAAVSDYKPAKASVKKISSGKKELRLKLVPTPKLVDWIKDIDPKVFGVAFKFDPAASKAVLIAKAKSLLDRAKLDLVVANGFHAGRYKAYIVSKESASGPFDSKELMARELLKRIGKANA